MDVIQQIYQIYTQSTGVNTDTRSIEEGQLFFALKGGNFDGNKYATQALEQGAIAVVVDDESVVASDKFVLVDDVLEVLQKVARMHRDTFSIPFFGITGSNGKTTTKELLYATVSQKFKTVATKGNLNNHIGVPLTLLSIPRDTEFAIIEMGANHVGEIAELSAIANPTHGLITNIGKAHLEGFGSIEGVARGKSELYLHLMKNAGVVFVNGADEHLVRMSSRIASPIYYSHPQAFYPVTFMGANPNVTYKDPAGKEWETNLIGEYNFNNIAAALTVGKFFEVSEEQMHQALVNYVSDNNRSEVRKIGTNTIILDAYNANPSSMKSAITTFAEMAVAKKVVMLGDMFELGDSAKEEHQAIADLAIGFNIDEVYLCGHEFEKVQGGEKFLETTDLKSFLEKNKFENTHILIKGSRGMKMESLLEVL